MSPYRVGAAPEVPRAIEMRAPVSLVFGAGFVGIAIFAASTKDWIVPVVLFAIGLSLVARDLHGRQRRYALAPCEKGQIDALDPLAKRTRIGAHQLERLEHTPSSIMRILGFPGLGVGLGEGLVRVFGLSFAAEIFVVAISVAVMIALLVERARWVLLAVPGRPDGVYFRRADLERLGVPAASD